MSRSRSLVIGGLAALLLLFPAATITSAAARPSAAVKRSLTVKVTKAFGTVWGTVTNNFGSHSCSRQSCVYKVAQGTSVTLTQAPKNSATWPFCHWLLNGRNKGKGKNKGGHTTLTFAMPHKATVVKAVYTLPGHC